MNFAFLGSWMSTMGQRGPPQGTQMAAQEPGQRKREGSSPRPAPHAAPGLQHARSTCTAAALTTPVLHVCGEHNRAKGRVHQTVPGDVMPSPHLVR